MDIDQQAIDELQNLLHSPSPEPSTESTTTVNTNSENVKLAQTLTELDEDEDDAGLFGDDDEEEEEEEEDAMQQDGAEYNRDQYGADDDDLTEEERALRRKLEYEEEDRQGEIQQKEETIAQLFLANIGIPASDRTWHARLPNFLNLDTTPFDEATWEPTGEDFDESSQGDGTTTPGGSQKAAVLDENVIRWRWGTDDKGNDIKETNSRIVRWSDGTLSLQIGSELFDISSQVEPTTGSSTSSLQAPHNPLSLSTFDSTRSHGLTYLTAAHDYSNLIEAQASIHGTFTFRPATTASNTHQKLAKSIAARNLKSRAIKMANVPEEDPERKKLDQEKAELERIKLAKREKGKQGKSGKSNKRKATKLVNSDGEEEEGEEEEGFGEDSDDEDGGFSNAATTGSRSQIKRGKGGALHQGNDEEEEDDDDDGFVVREGEDGDGKEEAEGSEDEIDERDQKIEREERRRKERKKEKKETEESDRPAEPAQGVRRRLVVDDDEDE